MTNDSGAIKEVALVTGANKGIGKAVAAQLGALGITVLIGARDRERGAQAAAELTAGGAKAHSIVLDVTDELSISAVTAQIEEEYGRLDILVNNAGIAIDQTAPSETTQDTFLRTYETNVFGLFGVTRSLLALLRKSDAGRIVNVSSDLGSMALGSDPSWAHAAVNLLAYSSSKAAVNMITVCLAKELRDTPIKVNAANPGFTATDLTGHRGTRSAAEAATEIVRLATLPQDGPTGGFFEEEGPLPW